MAAVRVGAFGRAGFSLWTGLSTRAQSPPTCLTAGSWRFTPSTEIVTMKKPVPDPPSLIPRFTTAHTQFGHCQDNQKPLFAVCAGVDIEDALIHLSMTLQSSHETTLKICELADRTVGDLAWRSCQSLEISRALVRALLEGIAQQRER